MEADRAGHRHADEGEQVRTGFSTTHSSFPHKYTVRTYSNAQNREKNGSISRQMDPASHLLNAGSTFINRPPRWKRAFGKF